jgi:hypothetical protein
MTIAILNCDRLEANSKATTKLGKNHDVWWQLFGFAAMSESLIIAFDRKMNALDEMYLRKYKWKHYTVNKPEDIQYEYSRSHELPLEKNKLVVAPSGSGKTYWINKVVNTMGWDNYVDADEIMTWPDQKRWWENANLARTVNLTNLKILSDELEKKEGKIFLYADDFNGILTADAVVLIDATDLESNLSARGKDKPGLTDLIEIKQQRDNLREQYSDRIIDSFDYLDRFGRLKRTDTLPRELKPNVEYGTTHMVRLISVALRDMGKFSHNMKKRLRREVILENFESKSIDFTAAGYDAIVEGIGPISVSGHMENLLIADYLGVYDINDFVNHILWNGKHYSKTRSDSIYLTEDNADDKHVLWHRKVDYDLAIDVFLKIFNSDEAKGLAQYTREKLSEVYVECVNIIGDNKRVKFANDLVHDEAVREAGLVKAT